MLQSYTLATLSGLTVDISMNSAASIAIATGLKGNMVSVMTDAGLGNLVMREGMNMLTKVLSIFIY